MHEWINCIRNLTEKLLFTDNMGSDPTQLLSPLPLAKQMSISSTTRSKEILVNSIIDGNKCADCGNEKPSWISLNLLTIVCLECSGIHRSLGPNVSKVRSLKLDNLNSAVLAMYTTITWEQCNKVWEGNAGGFMGLKPKPDSHQIEKEKWIKMKYVDKLFVKNLNENLLNSLSEAIKSNDLIKILQIIGLNKLNLNEMVQIEGKKRTYIHLACMFSKKHIIEFLLLNGCKLDALDQDSCKPLEVAMVSNNIESMDYLVKRIDDLEC